ncbi:MAG: hypothetical protein JW763_01100 [candidate division Zixibacteria bacterium]|nr:hypothetical protein [candidate division Zixibacteria bacterium]
MLNRDEREQLRRKLEERLHIKIRPRSIRAIDVNSAQHWQPAMLIEVGKTYRDLEYDAPPDRVVAIYESSTFLVCSQTRGVGAGIPYFFSKEDVRRVEEIPDSAE